VYSYISAQQVTPRNNLQYVDHKTTRDATWGFSLNERVMGKKMKPDIHGNFPSFDLLEEDTATISGQAYSSVSVHSYFCAN
jgi:hypothetical protein